MLRFHCRFTLPPLSKPCFASLYRAFPPPLSHCYSLYVALPWFNPCFTPFPLPLHCFNARFTLFQLPFTRITALSLPLYPASTPVRQNYPAFICLNFRYPVRCTFTHALRFLHSLNPVSPHFTTLSLPLYCTSTPFTSPYRILTLVLCRFHSHYVVLPCFNRRFTLFQLPFARIIAL